MTWWEILESIGEEVLTKVLPYQTTCIICRSAAATILPDQSGGVELFYCRKCGSCGNVFDIAAMKLSCHIRDLEMLWSHRVLPKDRDRVLAESAHRAEASQFWMRVQAFANSHAETVARESKLRASSLGWRKGIGNICGAANREILRDIPDSPNSRPHDKISIVAPLEKAPGIITGFWIKELRSDRVAPIKTYKNSKRCLGVVGMYSLNQETYPEFENDVFVFDSPDFVLRQHDRHLVANTKQWLPLVARCHQDSSVFDIRAIRSNVVFIVGMELDRHAVRSIITNRANFICDPGFKRFRRHAANQRVWLHEVKASSQSWAHALVTFLEATPKDSLTMELKAIGISTDELDSVSHLLDSRTAERLARIKDTVFPNRINWGSGTIERDRDSWFFRSTPKSSRVLITDAPFTVNKILRDDESTFLDMTIRHRGEEFHCTIDRNKVDKEALSAVARQLELYGQRPVYRKNWDNKALQVAFAFEYPPMEEVCVKAGWDSVRQSWRFPDFSITKQGLVEKKPLDRFISLDYLPGSSCEIVNDFNSVELHALRTGDKGVVTSLLLLASHIAIDLTNPILAQPRSGLAIVGKGANKIVLATRKNLGLESLELANSSSMTARLRDIVAKVSQHKWPVLVVRENPSLATVHRTACLLSSHLSSIIHSSWMTAYSLALSDGWNVLEIQDDVSVSRELVSLCKKLVPMSTTVLAKHLSMITSQQCPILALFDTLVAQWGLADRTNIDQHFLPSAKNYRDSVGLVLDAALRLRQIGYKAVNDSPLISFALVDGVESVRISIPVVRSLFNSIGNCEVDIMSILRDRQRIFEPSSSALDGYIVMTRADWNKRKVLNYGWRTTKQDPSAIC